MRLLVGLSLMSSVACDQLNEDTKTIAAKDSAKAGPEGGAEQAKGAEPSDAKQPTTAPGDAKSGSDPLPPGADEPSDTTQPSAAPPGDTKAGSDLPSVAGPPPSEATPSLDEPGDGTPGDPPTKQTDPTTGAAASPGATEAPTGEAGSTESSAGGSPSGSAAPLPWSGTEPESRDELLSDKMERRVRSTLRKDHDAMVQVAAKLVVPETDGGVTVLALYEYSLFEVCVAKEGGGKEARRKCADAATDSNGDPMAALRRCTGRGLVRARFGAPPAKNPAYGGALEIVATRPVTKGCTIDQVRSLRLHDVDGDGRPELEVDIRTTTPDKTFREPERFDVKTRSIGWYREDLTPQFERELASWGYEGEAMEETDQARTSLRDVDADGGIDLVLETITVDPMSCDFDGGGWPKDVSACSEGEVEQTVLTYDRTSDAWRESAVPSR